MTVRQLSAADVAAYRAIWLEALNRTPEAFVLSPAEAADIPEETLAARLDEGRIWGVFGQDALAGALALRRLEPARLQHAAEIGPLFVAESWQGRGLASRLLTAVLDTAAREGILQVELCVDETNRPAVTLYRKSGFSVLGRRPRSILLDGKARNDLLMIKALDGSAGFGDQIPGEWGE